MFSAHQKDTGTRYTGTIALLVLGAFFCPAFVLLIGTAGPGTFVLAACFSVTCALLARLDWKRNSRLTIPSFEQGGKNSGS